MAPYACIRPPISEPPRLLEEEEDDVSPFTVSVAFPHHSSNFPVIQSQKLSDEIVSSLALLASPPFSGPFDVQGTSGLTAVLGAGAEERSADGTGSTTIDLVGDSVSFCDDPSRLGGVGPMVLAGSPESKSGAVPIAVSWESCRPMGLRGSRMVPLLGLGDSPTESQSILYTSVFSGSRGQLSASEGLFFPSIFVFPSFNSLFFSDLGFLTYETPQPG